MRISARDILAVWEVGLYQTPAERALTLLSACCPKVPQEDLERISIGKRDALLLAFREKFFGTEFSGVTSCPKCSANLEIGFHSSDVRTEVADESTEPFAVTFDEFEFTCRLPNSEDLLAVAGWREHDSVTAALFDRCVLERRRGGANVSLSSLPVAVVDKIVNEIARRDPQADIRFAMVCPDCTHQWEAIFDIVSFAWNEICAWAGRLLRQVHTLAMAYGWREIDILSMSAFRRQAYLEVLGE